MKLNSLFVIFAIYLVTIFFVAKINYKNGRIEQCNEMDLYYTVDNECLTCQETGRELIDGECIVPNQWDFKRYGEKWFNTTT